MSETRCPFCGGALVAPTPGRGILGRTGGALAASLMSFGIGAGCLDDAERNTDDASDVSDSTVADVPDTTDTTDTRVDTSPDPDSIQPLYGLPMDVEVAEDTTPQPEYGLPMDTSDDSEDGKDTSSTDDIPIAPLYGLPPADTVEPADDATPQPEYGLPMDVMDDTGPDVGDTKDDANETESDGNIPVPLYGLPPG